MSLRRASGRPAHSAAVRLWQRLSGLGLAALTLVACVGGEQTARAPAGAVDNLAVHKRAAVAMEPAAPVAWRQAPSRAMAKLVGLDDAALLLLLGDPALKRREPPAEVWRYSGQDCTLHLFLYKGAAGTYRVVHAEARPLGDRGACLDRLIEERRPRPRSS